MYEAPDRATMEKHMSVTSPMNREDLLELAALDAFGLLSEYEAALYTRSFHYAPATVQDEILALQALIVTDVALLSKDEPPAELRRLVIERVAKAIEQDSPAHEPLATIGGRRTSLGAIPMEPIERHRSVVGSVMSRHFWRAAAFVMIGALGVIAYFHIDATRFQHELTKMFIADNTHAQIEQFIGPTFKEFLFNPAAKSVVLRPVDGRTEHRAVVYMVEGQSQGLLVIEGLEWKDGYELRVRDAAGDVHRVAQFSSYHRLTGVAIELASSVVAMAPGATWEIAFNGQVLLASV